jgi:protoporphyrinogen/coproporphyrinogen III oxidase
MKFDSVIIGAGFAGLLAAYSAATQSGKSVAVVEANEIAGGLIGRQELANISFDSGAEAFSIVVPDFENLLRGLNLGNQIVRPRTKSAQIISRQGRNAIPKGIFGIPTDLSDPALGFMGKQAIELAEELDSAPIDFDFEGLTVADLITRRLGKKFLENLVAPIIAGVHGSRPEHLEVKAVFPDLIREFSRTNSLILASKYLSENKPAPGASVASFHSGMHRLVDKFQKLLAAEGVLFFFNEQVKNLTKAKTTWLVETAKQQIQCESVVVATGARAGAAILGELPELAHELSEIKSVSSLLATAIVEDQYLNEFPLGSGAIVSAGLKSSFRATTHLNAKWEWLDQKLRPNQHLIRFSFESSQGPIEITRELIEEGLKLLYGASNPKVLDFVIAHWPEALVKATPGHRERISRIREIATAEGIELVGSYLTGNGLSGLVKERMRKQHAL